MTKKEFCLNNEAVAGHDYYRMQIHGFEYGINDYVYLTRIIQKTYCGETYAVFHKLKIRYYADGKAYIIIRESCYDGRKKNLYIALDSFIKKDSGWAIYTIPCAELKAIC